MCCVYYCYSPDLLAAFLLFLGTGSGASEMRSGELNRRLILRDKNRHVQKNCGKLSHLVRAKSITRFHTRILADRRCHGR